MVLQITTDYLQNRVETDLLSPSHFFLSLFLFQCIYNRLKLNDTTYISYSTSLLVVNTDDDISDKYNIIKCTFSLVNAFQNHAQN